MDYNKVNMNNVFTGFKFAFDQAFAVKEKNYVEKYKPMVMEVGSDTSIEEFPHLEQFSGMREWIGPRQIKNIGSKKLTVIPRQFEDTVGMPVTAIKDDKYGVYRPIVGQMGANAGNLKPDLVVAALVGNGKWLDGAVFFGTTRKYGGNTIVNKTTDALSETSFNAAHLAMTSYLGHGDTPLRVRPTALYVGPKNRTVAWNILNNQFRYDATDKVQIQNVNQSLVDLVILPDLIGTYDDYWYLSANGEVVKPIVLADREPAKIIALDGERDQNVVMENRVIYAASARAEAALAVPHLIYAGIL